MSFLVFSSSLHSFLSVEDSRPGCDRGAGPGRRPHTAPDRRWIQRPECDRLRSGGAGGLFVSARRSTVRILAKSGQARVGTRSLRPHIAHELRDSASNVQTWRNLGEESTNFRRTSGLVCSPSIAPRCWNLVDLSMLGGLDSIGR